MKARYIGHPDHPDENPRFVAFGGVDFRRDTWVGLPDDFKPLAKLKASASFEFSDDDLTEAEAVEAEGVTPPAATTAEGAGADLSKAATMERLTQLGVTFDEKLGLPKLRALLEAAEFEHGED